METRQSKT